MAAWKLEPILEIELFKEFARKTMKKNCPGHSKQAYWRYFTFRHMVGAEVHNPGETHTAIVDQFENGLFYSKSTLKTMEMKYLVRIAELKGILEEDDHSFNDAAQTVAERAGKGRQNWRSTRPGKIRNHS